MGDLRTFAEFLAKAPPGTSERVLRVFTKKGHLGEEDRGWVLSRPAVALHCDSEQCGGTRNFSYIGLRPYLEEKMRSHNVFMLYICRNCERTLKTYALNITPPKGFGPTFGEVVKIGEWPPFGPSIPSRFVSLIGPDRELFLKGRRAENQGLGVGAFTYYRRVVESNKDRLLDAIIKVGEKTGVDQAVITGLKAAKKETQFTRAIDDIKDGIPEAIRINGRNPLTLLHGPLSEGIHEKSDSECLELATSVREVLFAMAERIGEVSKEQQALDDAVKRLSQSRQGNK